MSCLLILAALRPPLSDPLALITRVFAAISIFSVELQLATWSGLATIRTLAAVNVAAAAVSWAWWLSRSQATALDEARAVPGERRRTEARSHEEAPEALRVCVSPRRVTAAVAALFGLVAVLNVAMPLEAADPYHLQRVDQIDRLGTLAYDLGQHPKVNGIGWIYEAVLADVRQIPFAGPALVRVHGVLGLLLYLLALATVRAWLPAAADWYWTAALVVPVVFHQLVLVKNDLFGAIPALVVLAWLAARADGAPRREIVWASWLAAFAVSVKLTSFPMVIVLPAALLVMRRDRGSTLGALAAGSALGVVCGGLAFTLVENARWYGDPWLPFAVGGGDDNRNATVGGAFVSVGRFAVSLFDLGLVARWAWPGRGGWGSTFGLPLIWALAVLAAGYRRWPAARRAIWVAASYFLLFALVYTDADVAHRMVLAPGILLVAVAIHLAGAAPTRARRALVAVTLLSAAQIARSAVLYLMRAA